MIAIIMGSQSDSNIMSHCEDVLKEFGILFHTQIISAHRAPKEMYEFATKAADQGYKIIIAGAGGAAHLPGMVSALTTLPVLAVPIPTGHLNGIDSLLSIVQMPAGVPTATFAIGVAGAKNAAYFAMRILGLNDKRLLDMVTGQQEQARLSVSVNMLPAKGQS